MTTDDLGEKLKKALLGDSGLEEESLQGGARKSLSALLRIDALEADLKLPEGFFARLLHDSDWSFVIKLHALFEAALAHMLTKHLGEEFFDIISHLEMSNVKTGKVALAAAAGLIDSEAKRYLAKLSEVRNDFVHDVSKTSANLAEHFGPLDSSKRKGYRTCFTLGFKEHKAGNPKPAVDQHTLGDQLRIACAIVFDDDPKFCIWVGAAYCLASISHSTLASEIRGQLRETEGEMLRVFRTWYELHKGQGGNEVA